MVTTYSRGRRQTDARALYRKMAEEAVLGTVSRSQLQVLAKDLPQTGLVNSTEAMLLVTLVHSAPGPQFEAGGLPIVFKSNATLGFEIGKSPNHTGALLSRLFDAGLIAMRDSGNYKRFARRDDAGNLAAVSGIDLRVLIARYGELNALVIKARSDRNAREAAWSEYRGAVRQLHLVLSSVEDLASRILATLTLAHEAVHWTAHTSRLDRDIRNAFGTKDYAREELVAELGAVFLGADLGVFIEPRADHANYLASWLEVLKEDKRAIFRAAAHAERAATFLLRLQPDYVEPAIEADPERSIQAA